MGQDDRELRRAVIEEIERAFDGVARPFAAGGQQMGYTESYRGQRHEVKLLPKVCLRIAVNEDFVQPTIDAIIAGARTGEIGGGKIFITDPPRRIRTGEEGHQAIG